MPCQDWEHAEEWETGEQGSRVWFGGYDNYDIHTHTRTLTTGG